MARNSLAGLPEVFLSTAEISAAVSRAVSRGEARKIGPRLYTTNTADEPEAIVRRNTWPIVSLLFPDRVVGYRTALEGRATDGGTVFVAGPYARTLEIPGLRIRQLEGPGPLEGDTRFSQSLWMASQARAFLEVLSFERVRGEESPALPRETIEDRLARIVQVRGEDAANTLRDRARAIAPELGMDEAFETLDGIVGALLGTRTGGLEGPAARARAVGEPYDADRLELFQLLHGELVRWVATPRPDDDRSGPAWQNLAFIDAYFSNFIEGTEFEIEEAAEIVFEGRIPETRPDDAHDVLGTYRLVADAREMTASVAELSFAEFVDLLKRRHYRIMEARPTTRPGEFKTEVNRAGLTVFVAPELVLGTLRQGFEMFRALRDPFQRAAFMMFLITEVHPFSDGNGRVARATMSSELISGGERRIFIPVSYREDYLLALRALSRQKNTTPLVRMLDRAQAYSAAVDFTDLAAALAVLRRTHAFERGPDARLRLPDGLA